MSSKGPEQRVVQRPPAPACRAGSSQTWRRRSGRGPALQTSWRRGSCLRQHFSKALVCTPLQLRRAQWPERDTVQAALPLVPFPDWNPLPGALDLAPAASASEQRAQGEAVVMPAPPSCTFFAVGDRVQTKIKQDKSNLLANHSLATLQLNKSANPQHIFTSH